MVSKSKSYKIFPPEFKLEALNNNAVVSLKLGSFLFCKNE